MTSTEQTTTTKHDIPAIDTYGNNITLRLSCIGPAIVTVEILTADTARLAEYHVSITNTGRMLTSLSACDRAARRWPETGEPHSASMDGDAI